MWFIFQFELIASEWSAFRRIPDEILDERENNPKANKNIQLHILMKLLKESKTISSLLKTAIKIERKKIRTRHMRLH